MKHLLSIGLLAMINVVNAGTMGNTSSYDFDGFYGGLGTGLLSLFTTDTYAGTRSDGTGGKTGENHYIDSAVLFTGQVGYGRMLQGRTYLGVKGSIYYSPIDDRDENAFSSAAGPVLIVGSNSFLSNVKPIYNIDAVLGYEVISHVLPFVEGGVTFGNVSRNYLFNRTISNLAANTNIQYQSSFKLNSYKTEFNAGLGLNVQPTPHCILSGELVYNDLGKKSGSTSVLIPTTTTIDTQSTSLTNQAVALFVGASYLF